MGAPKWPPNPERSARPGKAGALLHRARHAPEDSAAREDLRRPADQISRTRAQAPVRASARCAAATAARMLT